jgi:LmbE family N-acetylglucosaminyl deacetylase
MQLHSSELLQKISQKVMSRLLCEVSGDELKRPAIVFAPHPDDETLACGGTIIKKKRAGADVKIVFMTDGRQSHGHLIAVHELTSIRADEARAAAGKLGVAENDIIFLEFEDGKLDKNQEVAVHQVAELLQDQQPDQLFIPYYKESPADHWATNRIVLSALQLCQRKATIYEYPIWFWHHWPWVPVPISWRRKTLKVLRDTLVAGMGLRLLWDFNSSVYIEEVIELKREALNQHKSQMSRLLPDPGWATLSDVSDGEFLACFFAEREIFRRYNIGGVSDGKAGL